ncbi:hypothetical protein Trydic_g4691 [Trypoxylus dichotomus]
MVKWLDYKGTVLEVGCAKGSVTKEILYQRREHRIHKLVAIDKLHGMIVSICKKTMLPTKSTIMDNKVTDGMANKFDLIFSTTVAQLIPNTSAPNINFLRTWKSLNIKIMGLCITPHSPVLSEFTSPIT